ncbi:hypothetical protein U8335_19155 [Roseiconus lacunae]|uniref:hypothetical protein n=1 Tax=Roseiconus lacunae TaxID=2605694 RepID=UPI0030932CEC|nr:hypothetical protein U8335_19155 [Stieleria sp. HD01]
MLKRLKLTSSFSAGIALVIVAAATSYAVPAEKLFLTGQRYGDFIAIRQRADENPYFQILPPIRTRCDIGMVTVVSDGDETPLCERSLTFAGSEHDINLLEEFLANAPELRSLTLNFGLPPEKIGKMLNGGKLDRIFIRIASLPYLQHFSCRSFGPGSTEESLSIICLSSSIEELVLGDISELDTGCLGGMRKLRLLDIEDANQDVLQALANCGNLESLFIRSPRQFGQSLSASNRSALRRFPDSFTTFGSGDVADLDRSVFRGIVKLRGLRQLEVGGCSPGLELDDLGQVRQLKKLQRLSLPQPVNGLAAGDAMQFATEYGKLKREIETMQRSVSQ